MPGLQKLLEASSIDTETSEAYIALPPQAASVYQAPDE